MMDRHNGIQQTVAASIVGATADAELTVRNRELRSAPPKNQHRHLSADVPVLLGSRLELLRPIGHGVSGVVWKARQLRSGCHVAVKIPHDQSLSSHALAYEARLMRALDHPQIVQVFGWGMVSDLFIIELELLEGGSLADLLWTYQSRGMMIPQVDVIRWAMQLLRALEYVHMCGFVHADVKPRNLLLTNQGALKLIDFGASHLMGPLPRDADLQYTWPYAAPEVRLGRRHRASDIYALGVTLYELLTGHKPFTGQWGDVAIDPPAPRLRNPALSVDLEQIVLCAMAYSEEDRYPTCAAMRRDLARLLPP